MYIYIEYTGVRIYTKESIFKPSRIPEAASDTATTATTHNSSSSDSDSTRLQQYNKNSYEKSSSKITGRD